MKELYFNYQRLPKMFKSANKKVSLVLGSVVLLLLLLGLTAGYFVSQQQQDIRQQAAEINCNDYNNNQPACASNGCAWTPDLVKDCGSSFKSESDCLPAVPFGCSWAKGPFCIGSYTNSNGQTADCGAVSIQTCTTNPPSGCTLQGGYCYGLYSSTSGACSGPSNYCLTSSSTVPVNQGCGANGCQANEERICSCNFTEQLTCQCIPNASACGSGGGTDPGTDPGTGPGTPPGGGSGGGGSTSSNKWFNGTITAEDTGVARYIYPELNLFCLDGSCNSLKWVADDLGGHFDALAGPVVSLNYDPLNNTKKLADYYKSCEYTVTERNCSDLSTKGVYASGIGCTFSFEKSGTDCDWKYGVNIKLLKNAPDTFGNYSVQCADASQTNSNISYTFKMTGTQPKDIGYIAYYLGFYGKYHSKELTDDFLGKPTWSETCYDQGWCGYWLKGVGDDDNVNNENVNWTWNSEHKMNYNYAAKPDITINDIANKVAELKASGKLPSDYKIPVHAEFRLPNDSKYVPTPNTMLLDISPGACVAPIVLPDPIVQPPSPSPLVPTPSPTTPPLIGPPVIGPPAPPATPTPTPTPTPVVVTIPTPSPSARAGSGNGGPRGSVQPVVSGNPTIAPSVGPSGPMCLSICATVNATGACTTTPALSLGNRVTFTCGEVAGVSQYAFRVIKPDGTKVILAATGRTSVPFRIDQKGTYVGQCQTCQNGTCNPFSTPSTTGAVVPTIGPSFIPSIAPSSLPTSLPPIRGGGDPIIGPREN